MTRQILTTTGLLLGLLAPAAGAAAPARLALDPGTVIGEVRAVVPGPGQDWSALAAALGVHPVRIEKPSRDRLKDGLKAGEAVFVDQRRILPAFEADLDGIVLNLPEAHLYLLDKGKLVADWPVGVSVGESEWRAPIGPSKVKDKVKDPTWHIPAKIQAERARQGLAPKTKIEAGPKNPLGTRWIGFGDGSYGIHGTLDPGSIKRYASHGCVRMNNAHVTELFERVQVGTPIHVLYQPVLLADDGRAIWIEAFPDFYHRGYDYRAAIAALADRGGFRARLHNPAIEAALKVKDGLLLDVSQPLAPSRPLIRIEPLKPAGGADPAADKRVSGR